VSSEDIEYVIAAAESIVQLKAAGIYIRRYLIPRLRTREHRIIGSNGIRTDEINIQEYSSEYQA
jgi:hypothetical protein